LPDRDQLAKILPAVRNPIPNSIVWEPTDSVVHRFSWLEIPEPAKRQMVEATKKGNRFEIKLTGIESLELYLDDRMIDYRKPVVVEVNGMVLFEDSISPSLSVLCRSLLERGDPRFAFASKVTLPGGS